MKLLSCFPCDILILHFQNELENSVKSALLLLFEVCRIKRIVLNIHRKILNPFLLGKVLTFTHMEVKNKRRNQFVL